MRLTSIHFDKGIHPKSIRGRASVPTLPTGADSNPATVFAYDLYGPSDDSGRAVDYPMQLTSAFVSHLQRRRDLHWRWDVHSGWQQKIAANSHAVIIVVIDPRLWTYNSHDLPSSHRCPYGTSWSRRGGRTTAGSGCSRSWKLTGLRGC